MNDKILKVLVITAIGMAIFALLWIALPKQYNGNIVNATLGGIGEKIIISDVASVMIEGQSGEYFLIREIGHPDKMVEGKLSSGPAPLGWNRGRYYLSGRIWLLPGDYVVESTSDQIDFRVTGTESLSVTVIKSSVLMIAAAIAILGCIYLFTVVFKA